MDIAIEQEELDTHFNPDAPGYRRYFTLHGTAIRPSTNYCVGVTRNGTDICVSHLLHD